jgi:hypothetical protein
MCPQVTEFAQPNPCIAVRNGPMSLRNGFYMREAVNEAALL